MGQHPHRVRPPIDSFGKTTPMPKKREAQAVVRRSGLPCYRQGQSQGDTTRIIPSVGDGGLGVQLFLAGVWVVDESYRLFNCVWCHQQVAICSWCDRGQRYCSPHCRQALRRRSLREAGRRYQKTPHGARNNAARQKRWRMRSATRIVTTVTHHTSLSHSHRREEVPVITDPQEACDATSRRTPAIAHRTPVPLLAGKTGQTVRRCDFCGRPCGSFARWETLSAYSPPRGTTPPGDGEGPSDATERLLSAVNCDRSTWPRRSNDVQLSQPGILSWMASQGYSSRLPVVLTVQRNVLGSRRT